ncbi:SRPBCC family protein [Nitriliruptor alkaliphilus]|uniref:SRPBCC family protein n=1 Tax=Nitriliruptor alkaliphilus TaxID=427918 RepID=UPI000697102B|nr:SRPBCC family protein [Nitriliruptor alkaliphilus]
MSTVIHHETEISVDPDLPVVRITREFDAPPEKVFRAHTDPDLVVQWLGPRGLQLTVEHYDCRTGGSYRYTHADADGEYRFYGAFHEVRAPERIVQTFTYEGFPDGVSLDTLTFEDLGDGRTRLVTSSMLDSFEGRDAMLSSGMDVGVREGYERLDELLAS